MSHSCYRGVANLIQFTAEMLGRVVEKLTSIERRPLSFADVLLSWITRGNDKHDRLTSATAYTLAQVGGAMKAFYDATVNLGVASQVVTFTLSDFARTFVPNGNLGTDHAWGSHHFVVGGSVGAATSMAFLVLTALCSRRQPRMVLTTRIEEMAHAGVGYQSRL